MSNPVAEWIEKLRRIGRSIDSFSIEKMDLQKHRVDLFEKGEFVESIILYCFDKDLDSITKEIQTAVQTCLKVSPDSARKSVD